MATSHVSWSLILGRDNERLSLNICKTVFGYAQRLSQNLNERFTKTLWTAHWMIPFFGIDSRMILVRISEAFYCILQLYTI